MALILPLLLLLLFPYVAAQWQLCGESGNYTSKSTYQENLTRLSSSLPKKASSNATLIATDTVGAAPDTVFALAFCRGDIEASACEVCVATAFQDGPGMCPNKKDVATYYDDCMLSSGGAGVLALGSGEPNKFSKSFTNFVYFGATLVKYYT